MTAVSIHLEWQIRRTQRSDSRCPMRIEIVRLSVRGWARSSASVIVADASTARVIPDHLMSNILR